MENKTKNGIIVVSIVLIGAYFAYKKFIKPDSKKVVVNYLYATFGRDIDYESFVNKADKNYIDAWAKSIMDGKSTFVVDGKTYNTSGGTAVV